KARRLDGALPGDHDPDKRDRLLLSVRPASAVAHPRHHLARRARGRMCGPLSLSPCRRMAVDLCGGCCAGALPQRLRRDRAGFSEGAGLARASADAIRAAIPGDTAGRPGNIRHPRCARREAISCPGTSTGVNLPNTTGANRSTATPSIFETRRHQVFPILEAAEIERMRRFGTVRSYAAGDALVTTGEVGPGLTIILAGKV